MLIDDKFCMYECNGSAICSKGYVADGRLHCSDEMKMKKLTILNFSYQLELPGFVCDLPL